MNIPSVDPVLHSAVGEYHVLNIIMPLKIKPTGTMGFAIGEKFRHVFFSRLENLGSNGRQVGTRREETRVMS